MEFAYRTGLFKRDYEREWNRGKRYELFNISDFLLQLEVFVDWKDANLPCCSPIPSFRETKSVKIYNVLEEDKKQSTQSSSPDYLAIKALEKDPEYQAHLERHKEVREYLEVYETSRPFDGRIYGESGYPAMTSLHRMVFRIPDRLKPVPTLEPSTLDIFYDIGNVFDNAFQAWLSITMDT